MTDEGWRPLGFDSSEGAVTFDALYDGVPPWMEESFWTWIASCFRAYTGVNNYKFDLDLVRECERVCRFSFGNANYRSFDEQMNILRGAVSKNELRLADYLISRSPQRYSVSTLETVLAQSGSSMTVGSRAGKVGLVQRVPRGVQDAADHVIRTAGTAGARLAEAWTKAFGVDPDPSGAYGLAVRAVEDAAIPVVIPKQTNATLGHVISQLRSDGDWSLPLTREDPNATTQSVILSACGALWKGHHDRHGGVVGAPMSVSQAEAEVAVTLAVPLVQWFAAGMVGRR